MGSINEGVEYRLILAPRKDVMTFIRIQDICYDFVFGISCDTGGYPHARGHIPLRYHAAAGRTWLDRDPALGWG